MILNCIDRPLFLSSAMHDNNLSIGMLQENNYRLNAWLLKEYALNSSLSNVFVAGLWLQVMGLSSEALCIRFNYFSRNAIYI